MIQDLEFDIDLKQKTICKESCKQNDTLNLIFNVFDNCQAVDLTGFTAILNCNINNTNEVIKTDNITINKNQITIFDKDKYITTLGGYVALEIMLIKDNVQKTSFNISLVVEKSVLCSDGKLEPVTLNAFSQLKENVDRANAIINSLEDTTDKINNLNTSAANSNDTLNLTINKAAAQVNNIDTRISNVTNKVTDFETSVNNATKLKADLNTAIATATTNKNNLDTVNEQAVTNKNNLEKIISSANATNSALDTTIENANDKNTILNNTVEVAENKKQEVNTVISNAENKKQEVETIISNATDKIAKVETSIRNADNSKINLDASKELADNSKIELDSANNQASKNIDALKAIGDATNLAKDVETLKSGLKASQSLEYEGENITCENTLTSRTSDVVVKGQTYQNLVNSFNAGPGCTIDDFINISGTGDVVWTLCDIKVKPQLSSNKIYTVIYNCINTSGNFEFAGFDSNGKWQLGSGVKKTGINKFLISNKDVSFVRIQTNENDASIKIDKNIIILEGDWTNKEVPLSITRIESAGEKENKISILSHNKNLATITTKGDTNFKVGYVKKNKTYTLNINRENKSIKYNIRKTNVDGKMIKSNCSSDVNTFSCDEDCIVYINFYSKCNVNSVMLVEGDYNSDTMPKFEPPKEDKKEILLPVENGLKSLPNGVCDTIEQRTDGVYLVQRVGKVVLNGSENWTNSSWNMTNMFRFDFEIGLTVKLFDTNTSNQILCDTFKVVSRNSLDDVDSREFESITYHNSNSRTLSINISKSKLNNINTVDTFKQWLKDNPVTIYYELATPVETKLDIQNLDLEVYKDTTYITTSNAIQPTLSFKVPSNLAGIIQENASNVNELYKLIDEVIIPQLTNNSADIEILKLK